MTSEHDFFANQKMGTGRPDFPADARWGRWFNTMDDVSERTLSLINAF